MRVRGRAPPTPRPRAFPPSSARRRRRRPAPGRGPAARSVGAAALAIEPSARSAEAASSWRPRPDAPGDGAEHQRRDACGEAGDRPQLTGGGRRHVEVAGGLGEDRRHRDHRRLAREQAQEEGDAHRAVPAARAIRVVSVIASPPRSSWLPGDRRPVNGGLRARQVRGKADARSARAPRCYRAFTGVAPGQPTAPVSPARDRSGTEPDDNEGGARNEHDHGDDPQRRRHRAAVRDARRDQGGPLAREVPVPGAEPLDRRRAQPHDDPRLLRREPGGHVARRGVRASTPASRRSCSAPTPARTRPSTCCTRSPRA